MPGAAVPAQLNRDHILPMLTEASRLSNDYGDGYEVMLHMGELADIVSAMLPYLPTSAPDVHETSPERAVLLAAADTAEIELYVNTAGLMDATRPLNEQATTVHAWLRAQAAKLD